MPRARREFSDKEKADALAALDLNGGDVSKTARELGIARKTLDQWSRGQAINDFVAQLRQHEKVSLLEIAEQAAHALAEVILARAANPSPFDKTSELSVSFGIVVDKMQLLKGEPTAINQSLLAEEKQIKRDEFRRKREELQKAS